LTKNKNLVNYWEEILKKKNIASLFRNLQINYLIFGTAMQLIQNKKFLDNFLASNYSSQKIFWTEKPFACPDEGCNYRTSEFSKIKRHIERHKSRKAYICEICKKEIHAYSRYK